MKRATASDSAIDSRVCPLAASGSREYADGVMMLAGETEGSPAPWYQHTEIGRASDERGYSGGGFGDLFHVVGPAGFRGSTARRKPD